MATVRISSAFVHDVKSQISGMRETEIHARVATTDKLQLVTTHKKNNLLTAITFGQYEHLIDSTPPSWLRSDTYMYCVAVIPKPSSLGNETITYAFEVYADHFLAPNVASHHRHTITEELLAKHEQRFPNEVAQFREHIALLQRIVEAREKWRLIENTVAEFFESMPSLNKALELRPEMALYVPQKYMAALLTVKPRAARAPAKEISTTLDTAALAAAAAEVQMIRATQGGA